MLLGVFWFTHATFLPFLTTIFHGFGYDNALIGRVMMIAGLCSMLSAPTWGMLCDRFQNVRAIVVFSTVCGSAAALALPYAAGDIRIAVAIIIVLYFTFVALSYILDVWVIRLSNEGEPVNFAFVRAFGSLGYAVGGPVGGWLMAVYGVGYIPYLFPALSITLAVIALFVRNPKKIVIKTERPSFKTAAGQLIKNRAYIVFFLSCFLVFLGSSGVYSFVPIHIMSERIGGTSRSYGLFLFLTGVLEMPLLLAYKRLSRKAPHKLFLTVAFFFHFMRIVLIGLAPNMAVMYIASLAYMLSWGLFIGAIGGYLPEIVDIKILFTAQTVSQAFASGMASIVSNFFAGTLADAIGTSGMITRFSLLPFAGFMLFFIVNSGVFFKNRKNSN